MQLFKSKKLILLILIVLTYYVWITTAGTNKFNLNISDYGAYISYNHLVDSFLEGKLNLLVNPNPELANLKDPYEPRENINYRWHDASYYKEKYYFYWGAVPALFLYVPYRLLTGYFLPDNLAVLIFMFSGFLFSVAFLLDVRKRQFPNIPEWMILLSTGILGFSNIGGFMVRQAGVYQVAISGGYFFLTASTYFLYRAIDSTKTSLNLLFIGGLCLGLSVGSRANLLFGSLILIYLSVNELKKTNNKPILKDPTVISLLASYGICLMIIGIYNYLRFGNPIEFGLKYQLGDTNLFIRLSPFSFEHLPTNFYFNLFHSLLFNSTFPYVHFSTEMPTFSYFYSNGLEKIAGILTSTPFILLIVVCGLLNSYKDKISNLKLFKQFYFQLVFFTGCINLIIILLVKGVSMRYQTDYATLLILAACFALFYSYTNINTDRKKIVGVISCVLGIYSICTGAALGFKGADDHIKDENPIAYKWVINSFKPLSCALFQFKPTWENVQLCLPLAAFTPVSTSYTDIFEESNESKAFDEKLDTEWRIPNGMSGFLIVKRDSPAQVKSIWLLPRKTSLIESWQNVNCKFYLNDNLISEQSFSIENSYKRRIHRITFNPIHADKIELTFYNPNTIDLMSNNVAPNSLNPGYIEIVFETI